MILASETRTREMAPGAYAGRHTHPGDEISHVMEGEAQLLINGQPRPRLCFRHSLRVVNPRSGAESWRLQPSAGNGFPLRLAKKSRGRRCRDEAKRLEPVSYRVAMRQVSIATIRFGILGRGGIHDCEVGCP